MNKSLAVLAVLLAATVAYAVDPNPAAPPISVQQMLQNSPKETAPQGSTRIIAVRGGVVRQLSYSSIHGTPGATGPQGPTGATGAQGIQGPQGNAGASGPNQVTSSTSTTFASGTLLGSNGTTVKAATGAEVRAVLGVSTLSGSNTGDQDLSGLVVTTDPRLSDARTPTAHNHSGANITSGTVPSANGGAGTVNGILKANGAGVVSAATAGTDYLTPTGSAAGLTSFPTLNQSTTGNAATATALAANPADCSAGQYATTIAANGALTCAQVSYSQVSSTPTIAATISCGGTDKIRAYDAATGTFTCDTDTGGGGSTPLSVAADYPADIASDTTAATPAYVEEAIANAGSDATYTNIVDLWDTCTAGYLKFDGTCSTPSGSMTWPSTAGIPYWTSGTAWGGAYNATTKIPANYVDTLNQNTTGTAAGLSATLATGSGGTGVTDFTYSGTAHKAASVGFTNPASAKCVEVDANGNLQIAGTNAACGSGGGGLSTSLTSAHIYVGNGSGVATDVAVSGDISLANTGAMTVVAGSTSTAGKLQLTDSTSSTSTTTAATPASVKTAYDLANGKVSYTPATPGNIGTTTPGSGAFTTVSATGQITSTLATGTAPLTIASTTMVSNLNVDQLDGQHGSYYRDAGNVNAGILGSAYGGTGNGFTKFSGPTTAEKTFTLPNSSATLLYSGGALGTPSSGTLTNATGLPIAGITGLGTGVGTALGNALGGAAGVTTTIAAGTSALDTSAIASGACATAVATTATGTATTDVINWGFNGDPTGVTGYAPTTNGMLTIIAYPSANNVNYKVCNNTAASITPGAITLNWRVQR